MLVRKVEVESIILDTQCQARAELDLETIRDYTERYQAGLPLPPVDVFQVGDKKYLVDGFHRLAAARRALEAFLEVKVVGDGTLEEARWKALAANLTHGLRRTYADKRNAVMLALSHAYAGDLSSRDIAKHCDVSHTFVNDIRRDTESGSASTPPPPPPPDPGPPPPTEGDCPRCKQRDIVEGHDICKVCNDELTESFGPETKPCPKCGQPVPVKK